MNFEEMKVIWDQQNNEPLYAINQNALHKTIKRKSRGFKRLVLFFEIVMMTVALGLAITYVADILRDGERYYRLISSAIFMGISAYFFNGIYRRRRGESEFDASLLGDLEKALWQVKYHIKRVRGVRLGFILPASFAVSLDYIFALQAKPLWMLLLFLGLMAFSAWGIEKEISWWYLPKQRKLETLKERLTEADRQTDG